LGIWIATGNNLAILVTLFLGLWILYEYLIDFVLRLPRVFLIGTIVYFIAKTFMGSPI